MRYSRRVARAFLGSEARGQHPADIDEVVGNDSQTYPAMHARIPFIEAAAESVASLEHDAAPLAPDAPSLRFAEPALLLALATLRTLGAQIGNGDPCHSQLLRGLFVGSGEKSGVACPRRRDRPEPLLMLFNRGDQQGRVRGSLVIHLVGDDDLVFRFLDFDHLGEFGGLARFYFEGAFGGVFKQTDDLALRLGDAFDDPGARLSPPVSRGEASCRFLFSCLPGRLAATRPRNA